MVYFLIEIKTILTFLLIEDIPFIMLQSDQCLQTMIVLVNY